LKPFRITSVLRAVAVLAAAGLAVTACSSGGSSSSAAGTGANAAAAAASSGGTTTLNVGCAPVIQTLPYDLAQSSGAFSRLGLKTNCVQVTSGPAESAALLSGNLDVGPVAMANLAPLLDKGQNLVTIGSYWNTNSFDIVVRAGYPLPHKSQGWKGVMTDLKGAKIGVVARGAAAEVIARALYTEAGLNPDAQTYIATGLPATTVAALKSGLVDMAVTFEPAITLAVTQHIATQPFSINAGTGPADMNYADLQFVTTRSYAESHKPALCKFTQGWDQGLTMLRNPADKSQVDAVATSALGVPGSLAAQMVQRNLPYFPQQVNLDASRIDPGFVFLHANGAAQKAYTVSGIGVKVC
jgi:ABC-type nitrate/sulfonate/bicarbonate transport system substrate-binding protein